MKWRYHCASLTIEEYIRAYAHFTPIPFKTPANVLLDRARQAYTQKDIGLCGEDLA